MEQTNDKPTILFMLAVMAFAIILVDDRWVRVGLGLLPALLLAQRALLGGGVGSGVDGRIGWSDRRTDLKVRGHIDELLKHFREFYTTCHLMGKGNIDPDEARKMASGIERQLNTLLADVMQSAEAKAPARKAG